MGILLNLGSNQILYKKVPKGLGGEEEREGGVQVEVIGPVQHNQSSVGKKKKTRSYIQVHSSNNNTR